MGPLGSTSDRGIRLRVPDPDIAARLRDAATAEGTDPSVVALRLLREALGFDPFEQFIALAASTLRDPNSEDTFHLGVAVFRHARHEGAIGELRDLLKGFARELSDRANGTPEAVAP